MANIQDTITEMGQLSNLAYISYGDQIYKGRTFQENFTLKDKDGKPVAFYLDNSYTVIDYDNNSGGHGMEAVLLRNNTTGKFVIAFRGTQEPEDYVYDVTTGFLNYNPQIPDATKFVNDMIDKYGSSEGLLKSNLTLTGHSLGGILTQAIGADLRIPGYTFNSWSSSNLIDYTNWLPDPLGLLHRVASWLGWGAEEETFAQHNILNISYTDSGMTNGDPLSNALSEVLWINKFLGPILPIFGENLNTIEGHRMPNLIKALNHYDAVLKYFENKDFVVLTMAYMLSDLSHANKYYETTEGFFNLIGLKSAALNSLSFNFLNDLTQFEIADQAKSDRAVLFALIRLNGFAVEGNLNAYNLDLSKYSSQYIEDRSLLLYTALHATTLDRSKLEIRDRGFGIGYGSSNNFDIQHIIFGYDGEDDFIEKDFGIIGGNKEDHIYGMGGDDKLFGGAGDDILDGGEGNDKLYGGTGNDTYYSGDGDTISDEDRKGKVYFEEKLLTGGTLSEEHELYNLYQGDGGTYYFQKNNNTLIYQKGDQFLTIEDFYIQANTLEITLSDGGTVGGSTTTSNSTGGGSSSGGGTSGGGSSSGGGTGETGIGGDPTSTDPSNPTPTDPTDIPPEDTSTDNPKDGHPFDPTSFDPPRRDPLVLDLNHDGKISTVSLSDSNAYFDLTGDGIKEKVGWVQASEGIVVFDKNGNSKIDGISEVFGTATTSGFAELRALVDTNYDGVIDRRDELYSQLKVWQDTNGDGISQSNELKSLSQVGVKNIELNVIGTNINLNGNILSEAGRYGDSRGTRSLAADIELTFDSRITTVDTALIPDYTIHPEAEALPKLRGYGVVYNSEIAYNINPHLISIAQSLTSDLSTLAQGFDQYLAEYSGFNTMLRTVQEKYALSTTPILSDMDKKVWIYEHFMGVNRFSSAIESRILSTAEAMQTGAPANVVAGAYNTANVNAAYTKLHDRYEAMFALQSLYPQIMNTMTYNVGIDEFVISDTATFTQSITDYFNNPNNTIESKLYLADAMNTLETTFLHFTAAEVTAGITDPLIRELTSAIYTGTYKAHVYENGTYSSGNILAVGSENADMITIGGLAGSTVLAGRGDDIINGSKGNDVYLYRTGDRRDTIIDGGGSDTLRLTDLFQSDIVLRSEGKNLIIARFEYGKTFEELSDKVTFINWLDSVNRIENIVFSNGSSLDFSTIVRDYFIGNGDDRIDLSSGADTIDSLGGNDILHGLEGNDSLDGGAGNDVLYGDEGDDILAGGSGNDTLDGGSENDTYLYNLGDGKDVILNVSGKDTLQFGAGISIDSLFVQYLTNGDMVIGLKEDAKTLSELSDTITIRGWNNPSNHLESILLSDGSVVNLDTLQIPTEGDDLLTFGDNRVSIDLLGGNDTVISGSGNDVIDGGYGDDILIAGVGNDILNGGVGSDTLQGGLGDDLYLYSRGDGKDTIIDEYRYGYNGNSQSNAGNDTLRFGEGVTTADLIAKVVGDDLILALKEEGKTFEELGDVITIKNWVNPAIRIETIRLNDGSIVDLASIQSASEGNDNLIFGDSAVNVDALGGNDTLITGSANDVLHGGEGADTIRSQGGDDTLYGDAGNDVLYAGSGNDILNGGEGADILYGESGNDTLAGNGGNDTLVGGLGNDTYLFGLGDGHDTIIDEYTYGSGGNDTLCFGEGITTADLVARSVSGSNDLQIGIRENGKGFDAFSDIITLKKWFDASMRIENFVLSDGTSISLSQIQAGTDGDDYLVFVDTDTVMDALGGNDTVITANGNDTISGGSGNDVLITNSGNDTLSGGEGNDILKAGDGNDILSGGIGNDTLEGGAGNDTYCFGIGDGKDRITDGSGVDSLIFGDGISTDNLVARVINGSDDLQIAIREDGKSFDQLSDVITISGWRNAAYRIENLRLSDGTAIALTQIERSSEGDDYLVFGDEGGSVNALGGNDTIITGEGADTLIGGAGSDILKGGKGNDTYLFNLGDGVDTIFDELGSDTLKFGDGITKNDLIFKQQGNNLVIGIAEINKTFNQLSDVITITDWFKFNTNIESIVFADNTSMSQSDIAGLFVANNIDGALYSKLGAIMYGGSGNNTYVYNRGDFAVVIDDQYQQGQIDVNAGNDTLYLSGGINKSDVTFGVVGNDLVLKIAPKVDTYEQLRDYVIIKNWANVNRGVEKVIFSNGETLNIDKTVTYPATAFNYAWVSSQYKIYGDDANSIIGTNTDETFETNGGNDTINTGGGNDRIYAGPGNDVIEGGAGNDVTTMGTGDDSVTDSGGNDVYQYNKGDGKDTIYDLSGNDTVLFGAGISADDLMFQVNGKDLIVAIKNGDMAFDTLSDKIIIKDYYNLKTNIETFSFASGEPSITKDMIFTNLPLADNSAMKLDGADDALVISNSEGLNVIKGLTLTSTFSYNGMGTGYQSSTYGMLVTKAYTNYAASYSMAIDSTGKLFFQVIEANNTSHRIYSNTTLHTGTLYDVAGMYDQSSGVSKIYINGVLDTEANVGIFNIMQSSERVVVGAYWGSSSSLRSYLNGTVSDVQIYDRALSETEVSSIANGGTGSSGLLTHFDFEGSNPLLDSSANGFTAIPFGNPIVINNGTFTPPIILDLNHDGITSVSLDDSYTYFDYAADGLKEHTAWIEKGDALLIRDINNDGIINDGSELFGDRTKLADGTLASDGYSGLAQYDTNNDGVIDKNDANFSQLKLWKDTNQNGKTDVGELVDLSVAGVTSLSLNRANGSVYTQTTENGNIVTNETNYSSLAGTGIMRDVWFKINATDTITDNDTLYGTSESEILSGDIGNDTYVIAYGGGSDVIDDNGTGADTLKFISGITADRLVVQWIRGTDDLRIGIRENAENDTPITELPNTILIKNWFNDTGAIEQFIFGDGTKLNRQGIYDLLLNVEGDLTMRVLDAGNSLSGNSGNDVLYGLAGSETLYGKEGSDYLSGLAGDDYLIARAGDDALEGGKGDDQLEGGSGDDYYLFEKGDGKDVIIDSGGIDTLYFGNTIDRRDVVIKMEGEDLIVTFSYNDGISNDAIDQITIKNWNVDDFRLESFAFSDGKEYTLNELIAKNTNHAPEMFFEEGERTLGKERSAKGILLADDMDGDSLSYSVTSAPTMGTISINQYGIWSYSGTSRNAGTDTVTIAIKDGRGETTTTLSFVMEALNQAPEAPAETTHTLQDIRILSGEIGATDPDGDTLTYTVSSAAAHGTIIVDANGVWNYSAANGYMGSDSAIITIDDGNGGVITQTLNFDVKVSAPTLSDSTSNLLEDTSATGVLNVTNPVGGILTYEVLTSSSKGSFNINEAGDWNYTPNADLNGDDSVILKVTNEYGLSTTTRLSFAIEAVNDAPNVIGTVHLAMVNEDSGTITITAEQLLSNASDVDGDTLSIKNLTASSGTLIDNHDGTWSLIPSANFNGTITLNYSVSDTQIDTAAIATQYLVPVNDAPVIDANNQHFLLENTRTMGGTIAVSDVDGDTLAYSVSTQATHGVVSVDSYGNWTYKADGSFNGEDSAIVTIDDGHGGQVTSVLNFTVKGYLYEGKNLIINDNGTDTLVMTSVNQEDMTFSRNGNDLAIRVNNGSTVTLKNFFTNITAGVQTIATAQGNITLIRDAINNSQYGGYSASDSNDHLIIGDDNSNWLIGNGGDDIIVAGSGYDYVNGGDGNDLLIGGSDADNLFGGNGNDTIYADDGNDSVYAGTGNDELFGGNGDDTLFADDGNDTVSGGAGNDTIYAGTGNDTIKGGTGNDSINGDTGSDTYLFNIGDGNDTIVDTSSYGSLDKDTLVFGAGITKNNLQFIRDNYDLVLKVNDNDSVRIQYWFGSDKRNTLESILFADQTTLTTDQINNLAIVKGSTGNDWISGIDYMNDHMYGLAGNDGLYGYGGNDTLDGGDGNDIVDGGAGNDTLIGSKGADSLNGGYGSDTYSFSIGDGADTITDWSQYGSNDSDCITFGAGITKNDVRFMMKNGNLLIGYAQNDTINVQYAKNSQAQIEKFTLSDGKYLTSNDLNVIIQSMNAYATDHGMSITSLDTVKNNQSLMNIVAGAWHP
ncbi:MAG: hypothetical protein CJD30_09285 [Sulfuricurvum sp. PD_MW2]|uniref:tandem-95 repeat protein n=1 Tax=Sulfuricurvum sp. PD_MW2 TaxID=2027917 RepID=UPI000C06439E|nr:tandem-95 repeat protein [Sulfuricurvum sp. PD_MW2]PHM16873.1 MAG: hypothetical protein CJD30_09285 [Sulfuricurvum sp. PD_MW2]